MAKKKDDLPEEEQDELRRQRAVAASMVKGLTIWSHDPEKAMCLSSELCLIDCSLMGAMTEYACQRFLYPGRPDGTTTPVGCPAVREVRAPEDLPEPQDAGGGSG
jgi:hypothetical protein